MTHTPANNASRKQADTTKATPSTFQAHKHQRSPLTVHLGLPLCTHSSQPHYAGSNHHAPPPALALLRWCHLAYCQVGPKARALPHTRPTVRPSMANCRAGLSRAPLFTPHAAPQATTNQHNQAIHKVNTPLRRVRQKRHSHYRTALHMLRHNNQTELNTNATAPSEFLTIAPPSRTRLAMSNTAIVRHLTFTGTGML